MQFFLSFDLSYDVRVCGHCLSAFLLDWTGNEWTASWCTWSRACANDCCEIGRKILSEKFAVRWKIIKFPYFANWDWYVVHIGSRKPISVRCGMQYHHYHKSGCIEIVLDIVLSNDRILVQELLLLVLLLLPGTAVVACFLHFRQTDPEMVLVVVDFRIELVVVQIELVVVRIVAETENTNAHKNQLQRDRFSTK